MFNTNGYREFQLTQIAHIAAAKKAIATYTKALETGLSFAGLPVDDNGKAWLVKAITDQREVIQEVRDMPFRVGEW